MGEELKKQFRNKRNHAKIKLPIQHRRSTNLEELYYQILDLLSTYSGQGSMALVR